MTIQESVEKVFPLQLLYDKSNTPAMQTRGKLIREDIPSGLINAASSGQLPNTKLISDFFFEGSDGKGNKNYVPWVRFASKELSPSARIGWYITFLFSTDGSSVWLVIAHASTGGKKISNDVRSKLKIWGLSKLPNINQIDNDLTLDIDLKSSGTGLGEEFESTSLFGYEFKKGNVPSDAQILAKLDLLIPQLKTLYDAETNDPGMPSAEPIEITAASDVLDEIAGKTPKKRKSSRQGFGGSAAENKAIERRAVDLAIKYFESTGEWETIKDTGATESYDLFLSSKSKKLYVEVKGTQSSGEKVLLTKNEVSVQKEFYPNNALVLVFGIKLIKGDAPIAEGGTLKVISPWELIDADLTPMAFEYLVPFSLK